MSKHSLTIRAIALGGILAAMSVILKFVSIENSFFRITFFDIPVMFVGIILGPLIGGMVGLAADLSKISQYGINLMTLSSIMWGVIPGIIFYTYYFIKKSFQYNRVLLLFTVIITSFICFSINTVQLYIWTDSKTIIANFPIRIGIMIVKWPIQYILLSISLKQTADVVKGFRKVKFKNDVETTSFDF